MGIRLQTIADIWSKVGVLWGGLMYPKSPAKPLTGSHLARAGAIPLRIAPDKRVMKFITLPLYELEISKKNYFHLWPCEILQIQNLAYLPNSDTFGIDRFFHFMTTNSTFHDYFRLLQVVDNICECENQFFLVGDGQKWPNLGVRLC